MSDSAFKSGLAVLSGARSPAGTRLRKYYPWRVLRGHPMEKLAAYEVKYKHEKIGHVWHHGDNLWRWYHRGARLTDARTFPNLHAASQFLVDIHRNWLGR